MSPPTDWDAELADRLIGALVVVGLTRESPTGPVQEQMFGIVTTADPDRGVELMLEGSRDGESYWLPPQLDTFEPAPPGEYRLRTTGEVVVNPDFTCAWTIKPPVN